VRGQRPGSKPHQMNVKKNYNMLAVKVKLMRVNIENLEYQELEPRYDSPETLWYFEPPYDTPASKKYFKSWKKED
jgi:site-specific DNA-adenine methylase